MKHLKEIVLERRNVKDYRKYVTYFNEIFIDICRLELEKTFIFEEDNIIIISLKIWGNINKKFIEACMNKLGDVDYKLIPSNGYQITLEFHNVPKSALEDIEAEAMSRKYNL